MTEKTRGMFKWPGIVIATLAALAALGATTGKALAVFGPVAENRIEIRGHHDTLSVMLGEFEEMHNEVHLFIENQQVMQKTMIGFGFILCDLAEIKATDCRLSDGN